MKTDPRKKWEWAYRFARIYCREMGNKEPDELIDWASDLLYEAYLIVRFDRYGDPLARTTPKERAQTKKEVEELLDDILS